MTAKSSKATPADDGPAVTWAEASTSTAVVFAVYEFYRAVRKAIGQALDGGWAPWDGQSTPGAVLSEVTAAQQELARVWGPAGIPVDEPCRRVLEDWLGSASGWQPKTVNPHGVGSPYSDPRENTIVGDLRIRKDLRRSSYVVWLLEAIAGEQAHPDYTTDIDRATAALLEAERAALSATQALNVALDAGDADRALQLRDEATGHRPKAVQDARRELAGMRYWQQQGRLAHAKRRVDVARSEVEAIDAEIVAAEQVIREAELRREVARAIVDDTGLIYGRVKADSAEVQEQLQELRREPVVDTAALLRAQTAAAIGMQVRTVQLPTVPTILAPRVEA